MCYKEHGYYTVIIEKPAVEDIGLDQTIFDPTRKWPKRRKTNAPTGLKRLWKHLKKFKFSVHLNNKYIKLSIIIINKY